MPPIHIRRLTVIAGLVAALSAPPVPLSAGDDTRIQYQGRLTDNGAPYDGSAELRLTVWDMATGGTQVSNTSDVTVTVQDGLFTADWDAGPGVFPSGAGARWLQVEKETGPGTGIFELLSPRQRIHTVPMAHVATKANNAETLDTYDTSLTAFAGRVIYPSDTDGRLPDNIVDAGTIVNGSLTEAEFATGALNSLDAPDGLPVNAVIVDNAGETFFANGTRFNQKPLYLSGAGDNNHGLAVSTLANFPFTAETLNGPVLWGFDRGFLGTIQTAQRIALTWDSSGRVGIGDTTPLHPLHVSGTSSVMAKLESSSVGGTWGELQNTSPGGKTWSLISTGSSNGEGPGNLLFRDSTALSVAMTILGLNRHVGIGTSNPQRRLHVSDSDSRIARFSSDNVIGSWLELQNSSTNGQNWSLIATGTNNGEGAGNFLLRNDTNNSVAMAVLGSNRNVGIGTTDPQEKLHVNGNIRMNATNILGVRFIVGDSVGGITMKGDATGDDFVAVPSGRTGVGAVATEARFAVLPQVGELYSLALFDSGASIARFLVSEAGRVGINQIADNAALNIRGIPGDTYLFNVQNADGSINRFQVSSTGATVNGHFTATGAKSFRIDHPSDPANKSLYHNAIEGPGYYTLYRGRVTLDRNGEAWAELPEYFQDLNGEANYSMTPIGAPMPDLYIAEEATNNRFKIAGGVPGKKVDWTVMGTRHDPYARDNPYQVVVEKSPEDRGRYDYPEGYGADPSRRMGEVRTPETPVRALRMEEAAAASAGVTP